MPPRERTARSSEVRPPAALHRHAVAPSAPLGSLLSWPSQQVQGVASAATRMKVKKLKKEAIAKAEAAAKDAATKGPKERSPHMKEARYRSCCCVPSSCNARSRGQYSTTLHGDLKLSMTLGLSLASDKGESVPQQRLVGSNGELLYNMSPSAHPRMEASSGTLEAEGHRPYPCDIFRSPMMWRISRRWWPSTKSSTGA